MVEAGLVYDGVLEKPKGKEIEDKATHREKDARDEARKKIQDDKAKKGQGPQKVAASMKETAGVLQNAKPHPRRPAPADGAVEAVARSTS